MEDKKNLRFQPCMFYKSYVTKDNSAASRSVEWVVFQGNTKKQWLRFCTPTASCATIQGSYFMADQRKLRIV